MKTFLKYTLFIIFSVFLHACSTLVNGPTAQVAITGDIDYPLNIETSNYYYEDVTLPQMIEVKRSKLDEPIRVSTDSTELAVIYTGKKVEPITWLGVVGCVGLVVDYATGNAYKPATSQFNLKPFDGKKQVFNYTHKTPKFYRHELSFGVGIYTNLRDGRFRSLTNDMRNNHGFEEVYDDFCGIETGPVSLKAAYFYHLNKKLALGLQYTYSQYYEVTMRKDIDQGSYYSDNIHAKSHAFLLGAKYNWLEYRACNLYSRVALGMMHRHISFNPELGHYSHDENGNPITPPQICPYEKYYTNIKENKWLPAYQISPIGVEAGRGMLRFFMEFGYGIDGVFSFGLNFNF